MVAAGALIMLALGWLAWRRTFAPVFNTHLASAARRSLPFDRVVAALMGDAPLGSGRFLSGVHRKLLEGKGLHEALRTWFARFPEGYLAAVEAGEGSDGFPRVLEAQDAVLNRWSDFSLRFVGAIFYPVLLSSFLFGATTVLAIFIVPRFSQTFVEMGGDYGTVPGKLWVLGLCTKAARWLFVGLVATAAVLLLAPGWVASLMARVLSLVGMRRRVAAAGLPGFFEQFSILLKSGLAQKDAFAAATRAVWLRPLRRRVEKARALWEGGASFPDALVQAVRIPKWMETLLRFGEASGKLPEALEECAGIAREKSWALREGGLKVLLPALVVAMGALVGVTVWAVFSPLADLIMRMSVL